jgi:THO complex subunit 2
LKSILSRILIESNSSSILSVPQEIFAFFETFLVPSLSLFPSNPAISTELWSVLELFPYDIRYKLYKGWKGSGLEKAGLIGGGTKPLPNVESEMVAGKAARYSLKRLSKDNIRDMSRQLAKVTHSNPLVVFATILSQIESYDNMVEVMVEAQRFVNPLGLDVLGHCVLGQLSGTSGGINRSRLKGRKHFTKQTNLVNKIIGRSISRSPCRNCQNFLSWNGGSYLVSSDGAH